jgi:SAM-dependent methyltransferase
MGWISEDKQQSVSLARWEPTPLETVKRLLELGKVSSKDRVYDLGCGDARILIMAVKDFGAKKAVGYEIRQDLCENSRKEIQRQNLQDRISVIKGNLLDADISEASVITLYLYPTANEILRPKLEKEALFGARVVSHEHLIDTWQIAETKIYSSETLYLYIVPQAFQISSSQ